MDAEPVVVEVARSDDLEDDLPLLPRRERALFIARVEPRSKALVGEPVRLVVHPEQVYLVSLATSENLLVRAGQAS
jgi:hypothetical protein